MLRNKRNIAVIAIASLILVGAVLAAIRTVGRQANSADTCMADTIAVKDTIYKYGLPIEGYTVKNDTIQPGQTLAEVLMGYGLTASKVYSLTQCPDTVFDVRKVRAGQPCLLLTEKDSAALPR